MFRHPSDFKAVWRSHVGAGGSDPGAANPRITLKMFIAPVQNSLTQQQKLLKWVINNSRRSNAEPIIPSRTPPVDVTSPLTRSFKKLWELLQAHQLPSPARIEQFLSLERRVSVDIVAMTAPATESLERRASVDTVAMTAAPATETVASTPSTNAGHILRSQMSGDHTDLDNFYQWEKTFPFHPNSSFIKAYQLFWKKYLRHRMSFEAFACINTFYGQACRLHCSKICTHTNIHISLAQSMVVDLILSIGGIITNFSHEEGDDGTESVTAEHMLLRLKEGNALYYDRTSSPQDKDRNRLRRIEDLRKAAQFPELRVKHQQVWLEALGIQLKEAMDFISHKLLGLYNHCVQYLESSAERARYRITLKNGCLGMRCLFRQ